MPYSTIITLIDLSRRPKQLLNRLNLFIEALRCSEFKLIIGHADRSTKYDNHIKTSLLSNSNIKIISTPSTSQNINLSKLRNIAMNEVDTEIVLFADIDIHPDLNLFRSLIKKVLNGEPISIAPTIYLSQKGTQVLNKSGGVTQILHSCLNFSPEYVLHWAIPSSLCALPSSSFWSIHGFDESYQGHGYEDLDFLIRYCLKFDIIAPSHDLKIDSSYRAPLLSSGFRARLARLCIPNLLDGDIAFHQFHKKCNSSHYYKNRKINAELFQKRISDLICQSIHVSNYSATQELIFQFFYECTVRGIDSKLYYALFDARPRYMLKRKKFMERAAEYLQALLK